MFLSKFQLASLLLLLLGSCLLLTSNAEAQQVHALLVIMDDENDDITPSVKVDEENVYSFLQQVKRIYKTNVEVLRYSAGDTTISNIQRQIRALSPGPDDVVLFYFSGHGGMISQTDRRTFLQVSDSTGAPARLLRSDIEDDITAHKSRLQIIITDCCSNAASSRGAAARKYGTFAGVRRTNPMIKNLFGEHEGLLHVNGATEGQLAWGLPKTGGIFTDGLIAAINDKADLNKDRFFEWSEIFEVAKENTGIRWGRLEKAGEVDKGDPRQTKQTPRDYSLPDRLNGHHTEFDTDLWNTDNPFSALDVRFSTDKSRYRLNEDLLTLTVRPDTNCYLTVLNWDTESNLVQLFPNEFDQNNRLRAGKEYQIPPPGAKYEFFTTATGIERLKIIAVTDRDVSDEINRVLSAPDDPEDPFRKESVHHRSSTKAQPRFGVGETAKKLDKQAKIAKILERLHEDEWTEDRQEVEVR